MKFAVIDTANLFQRCRHVVQGDAFTKAGMALHIVFKALRKIHRDMEIEHMVFCIEGRSWRHDVYPAYKRKRRLDAMEKSERDKEEDNVFYSVLEDFVSYIATETNCTLLQSEGVEGDDFVARWIQLHPDDEHVILSGDSDFIQLLAPNVTLIDGVNERIITTTSVKDYDGKSYVFRIDPSKGKLKVGSDFERARIDHDKAERERKKKLLEGVTEKVTKKKAKPVEGAIEPVFEKVPFSFQVEPEWWRKALFLKIIRGDVSDGIFGAYPGVRYEGTAKKTGIREAWDDRFEKGFAWNNFMLQSWEKSTGFDEEGKPLVEQVKVIDEFHRNETLIDLTKQPEDIRDLMDVVIVQAVQKPKAPQVGFAFMRFCAKQSLPQLAREAQDHARYLNQGYPR